MKIADLTDEQLDRLHGQVSRRVNYLWRLFHRMRDVGFDGEVYSSSRRTTRSARSPGEVVPSRTLTENSPSDDYEPTGLMDQLVLGSRPVRHVGLVRSLREAAR